ncbi:reverse transcriptase domain-containing protein [Tanacetum coccineum]
MLDGSFDFQAFDVIIRDKKGAENLAADHLSRLENPHQDKLENKEITETFPLETLGSVALHADSTPWFADFANYHGELVVKGIFGAPRAIISDRGTHFCNDQFAKVMLKYGVTHRLSTAYHPQTTYKTPIGCTPYKLVYGKACHLPIELEHKAYWALKNANFDLQTAGKLKSRWSGPFTIVQVFPYGTVDLSQTPGQPTKMSRIFEASRARGICPSITRASQSSASFGNPDILILSTNVYL